MADLPLFPLPETVVFPGMTMPLYIFEERYKVMVRDCLERESHRFVIVLARSSSQLSDGVVMMHEVGAYADIVSLMENPDGTFNILAHGQERCFVKEIDALSNPYLSIPDLPYPLQRDDPNYERLVAWDALEAFRKYARRLFATAVEQIEEAMPSDPLHQASFVCANLRAPAASRQVLLEASSLVARFELAQKLMQERLEAPEAERRLI